MLAYIQIACPSIGPVTLPANPGYVSADELALSVGTSPVFSLLALVSTAYTYGYGLNEVWLQGSAAANAEYVFPSKVRVTQLDQVLHSSVFVLMVCQLLG